MILCCCRCS